MPVLASNLLSSVYTSIFYLSMVWTFADQPVLLGLIVAGYEVTPNLIGLAYGRFRSPLNSVQQVIGAWMLRGVGGALLLGASPTWLRVLGILLVAATPVVQRAIERASFVSTVGAAEPMVARFATLRQLQVAASFAVPPLAGYLLDTGDRRLLLAALAVVTLAGLVAASRFPLLASPAASQQPVTHLRWGLPTHPVVLPVVLMMSIGNLVFWGPEAIIIPAFFKAFGMTATDLGLVSSTGRVAEYLALALIKRRPVSVRSMPVAMAFAMVMHTTPFLVLGITATHAVGWWLVAQAVANTFIAAFPAYLSTVVAHHYPDPALRVRALSTSSSLSDITEPVGALLAGVTVAAAPAIFLAGIGALGAINGLTFLAVFVRTRRRG